MMADQMIDQATADETLVSVQLSERLVQALERYRQDNKIESTTEAIANILDKFLNDANTPAYAPIQQVEALENWVKNLAEQVIILNQSVKYLSLTHSIRHQAPRIAAVELDEDGIEDEPDEILFDFLPENDR